jgi:hypothetical protein
MKRNQFTLISFTFLAGILLGATTIGLVAFTNPSPPFPLSPGLNRISLQDATALTRTYSSTASKVNEVVKGFVINKDQLSALNLLASENQSLGSFRIYSGAEANGNMVGVILGVDAQGNDITNGSIYMANGAASPCPPICDLNSPFN